MTAAATVTDISTATPREKTKPDNISVSILLPEDLYDKLMLDSTLSKRPVGLMVEDWIDQNVSVQDVVVGLASLMKNTTVREKLVPGMTMKGLSISLSKRHYGMIRMEALRQNTTIRALLKGWMIENVREWIFEPVEEHQEWQDRKAA
jgi:BarA-like signal transduction histidine kinase